MSHTLWTLLIQHTGDPSGVGHTLSNSEKRAYLDAEVCLLGKAPKFGFEGAKNRFEELQAAHQVQAYLIHGVCGYQGAQPYWDETRDAGRVSESEILDPDTGFGGDGVGERGCIADGPFAGYINSIGPGYRITDRCITRFVNNTRSLMASPRFTDRCQGMNRYVDVWPCLEGNPHNSGHGAISGLDGSEATIPADGPILIFPGDGGNIDWDEIDWEKIGFPASAVEMEARSSCRPALTFPEALEPPEDAEPQEPRGDPGDVTTLNHVLKMFGLVPDALIRDVMDIAGGTLCYEYV
ncbi:unnamed protein product [Parascedosporium putredinis]|uniref:Tyrosinase copper-binding domain-containing protein n=1 Tax=Parascedosporium putredinis TaxID=1442378 RepID=A0A9P1HAC4_9PEZI|nr:unnamed protein product [Parascedosporium putredinis]CAI8002505.1 unnamed protein product [Parascedosporium putredinis]